MHATRGLARDLLQLEAAALGRVVAPREAGDRVALFATPPERTRLINLKLEQEVELERLSFERGTQHEGG